MKSKTKQSQVIMAFGLLIAVLLTFFFPMMIGRHNCTQENCLICTVLRSSSHLLDGVLPVVHVLNGLMLTITLCFCGIGGMSLRRADTPVSNFDKLSD